MRRMKERSNERDARGPDGKQEWDRMKATETG